MDVASVTNLGTAGFAIMVMWWMYQSAAAERARNDERMDKKDEQFLKLNEQVRTEISVQLASSTSTQRDNIKIMERVIELLPKKP